MIWLMAGLIIMGLVLWFFGWRWERSFARPKSSRQPFVSIIIPAYNSSQTIEDTIKSAKNLDYPNKEIIVINDSFDRTKQIAKKHSVIYIQNKTRLGKAAALNKAAEIAKGEIFFFLDSDTTAGKDSLKKIVPWFSEKNIAAVSPKYEVADTNTFWTRMAHLETSFISSLFKTHMYFGSLITFRGCGVAIRKSVLEKLGGWPHTLIEDNYFAGMIFKNGYKIQYDHEAIIKTKEPETLNSLRKQRMRWGKGFTYTFFKHRKTYFGNPQFSIYAIPYLLLAFAAIGLFFWQTSLLVIPLISLYVLYAVSLTQFIQVSSLFIVPVLTNMFSGILAASLGHVALLTLPEKKHSIKDALLIIPYTFVYVPVVNYCYARGILSGIMDKKNKRPELDLSYW